MIAKIRAARIEIAAELVDFEQQLAAARVELAAAGAGVTNAVAAVDVVNELLGRVQPPSGEVPVAVHNRFRTDKWATDRDDIRALAAARGVALVATQKVDGLVWRCDDHRDAIRHLDALIAAASPSARPVTEAAAPLPLPAADPTARKRKRMSVAA
jgi:hypothetical protein